MKKVLTKLPENKKALVYWILIALVGTTYVGSNIYGAEEPMTELMRMIQFMLTLT